jgi:hypothetical protein
VFHAGTPAAILAHREATAALITAIATGIAKTEAA